MEEKVDMPGNKGIPSKTRYVVRLDCDHVLFFESPQPGLGSELLCTRCRGYRVVVTSELEWSLRCQTCNHAKRFGADPDGVRRAAERHLVSRPTHKVLILQGVTVRARLTGEQSAIAAWLEAHPAHQRSLRLLSSRDL